MIQKSSRLRIIFRVVIWSLWRLMAGLCDFFVWNRNEKLVNQKLQNCSGKFKNFLRFKRTFSSICNAYYASIQQIRESRIPVAYSSKNSTHQWTALVVCVHTSTLLLFDSCFIRSDFAFIIFYTFHSYYRSSNPS